MVLQQLLEYYTNGALNITINTENDTAALGGVPISKEQAAKIAATLGWKEYVLSPYEIINKTAKFVKGIYKHIDKEWFWRDYQIEFQNRHSQTYGKTFDRITIASTTGIKQTGYVILYNMENAGGKYVVYELNKSIPVAKCRNLKSVAEFINENI